MKPEIKQRIEQINSGNVPNGYKKTKVGIVPADWAVIKLSKVLRKQTTKNTNNAIHNVLTNSATQGIVNQTDFFDKQIANDDNTSGYYVVNNGCFVYNPRISSSAPCGPFNRYNGQESGIMSPLYVVYDFVGESQAYSDYLSLYFASSKWHSYMNSIANYGARSDRMNVTSESMNNMPLPFSPLPEQEKIAEILTAQDRVIELCEKKVEQLKKLKKVFLQKMFPKPGYTVPEWRFPRFTGEWERRRLGDVVTEVKRTDEKSNAPVMMITAENGFIYQSERYSTNNAGKSLKKYILLQRGELAYNHGASKMRPYGSCFALTNEDNARIPFVYHCFSTDSENSEFLSLTLNGQSVEKQLRCIASSGARMDGLLNISFDEYSSVSILLPPVKEQNQIADCFRKLDEDITLHQRKCDEEKQKKKALMQLLLTGIVRVKA